jgi:hypothetical protein
VADTDSIVAAGRQCLATQGLPDVVIANAGISVGVDTAVREDLDVIARTFATNNVGLAATFHPFVAADGGAPRRHAGGHRQRGRHPRPAGARRLLREQGGGDQLLREPARRAAPVGGEGGDHQPGYIDTPLTRQNRYGMPFLMQPEDFAERAFRTIAAGRSYRVIPWQMGVVAKLLRMLPNPLFDRVLAGRPRKHRQGRVSGARRSARRREAPSRNDKARPGTGLLLPGALAGRPECRAQ